MLQIILQKILRFYSKKNRWWVPLAIGLPFSLCLPPFNHEFHGAFALFPFFSFIALLPLFLFALQQPRKRAIVHTFLFSFTASLGQYYWLAFVRVEGLWVLILIGLVLISAFVALFYCTAALLFRLCYRKFPRFYPVLFPALWVLIDYSRTFGDLSFPWAFLGYTLTPLLPLSHLASVTGVWGLTYVIVFGNILVGETLKAAYQHNRYKTQLQHVCIFTAALACCTLWGWHALTTTKPATESAKVALLQSNIDQFNWGNHSIDSAFTITEAMVYEAAKAKPDLIVGPESALLCYLNRNLGQRNRIMALTDSVQIPILLGALHWDRAEGNSVYDYLVYNTAFLAQPDAEELLPYRKMKLVPFSEAFPFEAKFPILSRVNLGEADFKPGTKAVTYAVTSKISVAPFICYEIIYPHFVQQHLKEHATLMVHITNDGWFGNSTGPYHHATMARMRSIENGVSMARCANSGITTCIDPQGRILGKTKLGCRTTLTCILPLQQATTIYARYGDWFITVCCIVVAAGLLMFVGGLVRRKPLRKC